MDWETHLCNFLNRAHRRLRIKSVPFSSYERAFSENYRSLISPRGAARDLLWLQSIERSGRDAVDLRPPVVGADGAHHEIRMYSVKERSLDEIMPILQNLGLRVVDQIRFKVTLDRRFFIRSFLVEALGEGVKHNLSHSKKPLLRALNALLLGQAEDDALNRLILLTGLDWKAVDLFRAYRNYYLQLGGRFGQLRIHKALLSNIEVVRLLHRYFEARFAPDGRWGDQDQREVEALTPIRLELIAALDKVAEVNDDRILRDLFNLIDATLRTNFYFRHDHREHYIALKISSLGVINMPSPKPMVEIYVHSPEMEGVHLRGARVARGGIRWSDRLDDFRSEILDLMQTQMIKNALIVPQGAKGGFILKT